jgi:NTP pyrophosphatase (non-canonical NTP hydrolase)
MKEDNMKIHEWATRIAKWREGKGFTTNWENIPTKLMLVVTELAEAMEDWRNNDKDHFREEIADTFIRLFDICGSLNMEDIEYDIEKKMRINENRPYMHGKAHKGLE